MWHTDTAIRMLNVWDRWLRLPFKRLQICEWNIRVTVPFTTPYSVNIVWVICLCVLWEGAPQSNAYRLMLMPERNGWLAVMAKEDTIHIVDPRDSTDLFAIWLRVQSDVGCRVLLVFNVCSGSSFYCDWFGLLRFTVCIQQEENLWIYFSSLMSSFLNSSGECNKPGCNYTSIHCPVNY